MKYRQRVVGSGQWVTPILIGILSFALVLGRHFEVTWAGGTGFVPTSSVITVIDENPIDSACDPVDVSRENILTCSGERKKVTFGLSTIWMDENTSLVIANRATGSESLTFYGGRIVVQGPLILRVREREYVLAGKATFVNYSWLNRLDVFAIEGDVTEGSTVVPSGSATRFDTLTPYDEPEAIEASYAEGKAADFYSWSENH